MHTRELPEFDLVADDPTRNVGRDAEFLRLLSESYPRVHSLVVSLVGNAADADDVMQDASLVLWQKFDEYERGTNFARWAAAVAQHVTRNFVRKRRRRRGRALSEETLGKLALVHGGATELLELRRERLERCLRLVGKDDSTLLDACYGDGPSVGELAKSRGVKKNALYARLHRLRRELYDCVTRRMAASRGEDR